MFHTALLQGYLTAPLAALFPPRVTWNDVEGEVVLPTEVMLLEPDVPVSGSRGREEPPAASGDGLDGGVRDAGDDAAAATDGGVDGGADGGSPTGLDGGVSAPAASASGGRRVAPPSASSARPVSSAPPDSRERPSDPARLRDPLVMSGRAGALAGKDPNVSAMVIPESFRTHQASKRLGALLSKLPQWSAFLTATGLDPIADVDRVLIAGPQLKQTAKVAVVIKTRWSDPKLRAALERLRETAGGSWENGTPPVLTTTLDGAERFAVMLGNGQLAIVPAEALAQAKAMKGGSFPAARGAAFLFTLKQPGKALSGLPFAVPTSLDSVRLTVTMRADGGADVVFEGATSSAAAATIAADLLTRGIEAATTRKTFLGTVRLFDPVTFAADGMRVRAALSLHGGQLAQVIEIVGQPIEVSSAP